MGARMVEISEKDLQRLQIEFNRLRAEVEMFRAVVGAIMANALATRSTAAEFFEDLRAQTSTGLQKAWERNSTPQAMRDLERTAVVDFFDQLATQLEIAKTSDHRSGTH